MLFSVAFLVTYYNGLCQQKSYEEDNIGDGENCKQMIEEVQK